MVGLRTASAVLVPPYSFSIADRVRTIQRTQAIRSLGFRHDMSSGAPICRWIVDDILVDLMPTSGEILGFSNLWYEAAMETATWTSLQSGEGVRVISSALFLATKLTAFHSRGQGDYRMSSDIDDIIAVVDGRAELCSEVSDAQTEVRIYIATEFTQLLNTNYFVESIDAHLSSDAASQSRITIVMERMGRIASLK